MTLVMRIIGREINETRRALRALLSGGIGRNGGLAQGYRRKLVRLRAHRSALARQIERGG